MDRDEKSETNQGPEGKSQSEIVSGAPEYIVAIGGSAGGLDAFEQFLQRLPLDTGMAFVVIQHLDPTHKTLIVELLQHATSMPVHQATDGMPVEANTVYVIPPNANLSLHRGRLHVKEPTAPRGMRTPVDAFFESLAAEQKEKSIAIIVSGMGSDGTLGIKAVKEVSGVVMVQDPDTAKFDGMPRSAVSTGQVDFVAPIDELPARLISYVASSRRPGFDKEEHEHGQSGHLQELLRLVRSRTKYDFSQYKKSTLYRRVAKRTNLLELAGLGEYVEYVRKRPEELDFIFRDFLIGVTRFFRDPEAFDFLQEHALQELVRNAAPDSALRVWVAGCSTGEEAYSISMALHETITDLRPSAGLRPQIFATDIDDRAIASARRALYPPNIAADVPKERMERFFVEVDGGFRISRMVRETVVFAPHNLISDPPFTKMDLITCRNILIYFSQELQKRVLPIFHYALKPGGFLFLGTAESVSSAPDLFVALDNKHRVFRRSDIRPTGIGAPRIKDYEPGPHTAIPQFVGEHTDKAFQDEVKRTILDKYSPPSVVVDASGKIMYVSGRTGKYLEPAEGSANWNIRAMAREGLQKELANAIRRTAADNVEVSLKGLRIKTGGEQAVVDVTVSPLASPESLKGLILVAFTEPREPQAEPQDRKRVAAEPETSSETERELQQTRDQLRTMSEEMEAAQEELKSANEELQSTNEEVQSANEELISSKEELESLNEELVTLNTELQAKVNELTALNNDMNNLLNSTDIATLFLDSKVQVKRFTPAAVSMFNLRPVDIGRPLTDITQNLDYHTIGGDVGKVLESLSVHEQQVRSKTGQWYIMRIRPYRTLDNMIDGVVITFADVTKMKELEDSLRESETLSSAMADIGGAMSTRDGSQYVIALAIAKATETLHLDGGLLAVRVEGEWTVRDSQGLPQLPQGMRLSDEDLPYLNKVELDLGVVTIDDTTSHALTSPDAASKYGIRSVVAVPLIAEGAFVGCLSLVSTSEPQKYSDAALIFVRKLANSVSMALTNIRLYQSETHAKKEALEAMQLLSDQHTQLQQALVPAELPTVPGFKMAARFMAGTEGKIVGGDFYDVFATEKGGLAVLIGDVAGKGVDATTLSVTTRATVRAFAYETGNPCEAMAHAGDVIYSENGFGRRFVTVGLAVIDDATGYLSYASAGHPPAMVLKVDGSVELLTAAQLPMGVFPKVDCKPLHSHLDPGDKFVLYTDGISEARVGKTMYGIEGIQATLETHSHCSPEELLEEIFQKALQVGQGELADDAAVVIIERA